MRKERAHRAGVAGTRRKTRPRTLPKWLTRSENLDAIARSRCMMVLSVLSGEKPVTAAVREARISRGAYYNLESRALKAMLAILNPLATMAQKKPARPASEARIEALLERIARLEQDRRRTQRLLLLTRKSISAPVKTGRRGRLPSMQDWIPSGKQLLQRSKAKASPACASIPTKAGEPAP